MTFRQIVLLSLDLPAQSRQSHTVTHVVSPYTLLNAIQPELLVDLPYNVILYCFREYLKQLLGFSIHKSFHHITTKYTHFSSDPLNHAPKN